MAKESNSGGKYDDSSTFKTMPIGETQLQVLTADSTKAAISKIAKENDKANKKLLDSIEELSRTVEVLSKAGNQVGLDQSYRLLREGLSTIVSRAGWGEEGVVKEDKEFFKILEKFVSGAHTTPRKDDGREPGKAVEKEDLKSFEDHIARLLKDSAFGDINKALPKGVIDGINKEKDEAKNLFEWNKGLAEYLELTGQGEKAKDLQASADKRFEYYRKNISIVFDKLNGIPTPLSEGFKKSLPNTSNKNDDVLETVDPDPNAQSQEQIVKEQMKAQKAQDSEKKRKGRSKVVKETTSAEGEPKVDKGTTTTEEDTKKKDANTTLAEAVRTLFNRYIDTRSSTQEKQKIVKYAKENPDAMDNDFFLKVAKSSDELSKYLKNPEEGKVRDFQRILKDSLVDVLKDMGVIPLSRGEKRDVESDPTVVKEIVEKATTTAPSKEKSPAPSKVKENAKKIVEKATTTDPSKEKATTPDLTQTSLLDFGPKEKSTSEVEGEPGLSPTTPQNIIDINGMLKEAVSNIETSLIDMLDRTGNEFAKYMKKATDSLSSMFSGGGDLIHDSGSSGESSSYSSSEVKPQSRKESKGRGAKTKLPSDTSPKPPFRDAMSNIMAGELESPINSIGRVTSQIRDILARRKDDGPKNQRERIDELRKSITDDLIQHKKWEPEPEPEPSIFADSMESLTEFLSNNIESKGQEAKTELPSDTAPNRPFRDAISKIMAGEPKSPINSIGRVTSLFPDILTRKDDGPKNQKEKIDALRKSITDKKGEPEPELGRFAKIIKRLTESMSNLKKIVLPRDSDGKLMKPKEAVANLKTQVWPKDADGQPKNLREATKDAFDTTSKERDKARDDAPFAKLFEFIGNAKSDPIGTFGAVGENVTDMFTSEGEESGGIAKGLGAMTSGIGIVIALIQKLTESSPILKAVLELFNLAFTLFMMPFGNMIGEWLLPLAMKLIDYAVKFNEIFPKIREVFAGFKDWLFGIPARIGEKLSELKDKIVEKLIEAKDYIVGLPGKILEGIKTVIKFYIEFYKGIFTKIFEVFIKVKDYIFGLPGKIIEGVKKAISFYIDIYKKIFEKLIEVVTRVKDFIFGLPKKIWESLKGGATHLVNAIKDAVKGFLGKPVDAIKGVFGFAGGGYVPASPGGSIVKVGEGTRGEYIVPEGSSMLGGSGGQTINITFSGNVYGMRDFEDRVTEIVNKTSNKAYYR